MSSYEMSFNGDNDTQWSRHVGNGTTSGSVGFTVYSDRALTFASTSNSRCSRRANIWDPEFWSLPALSATSSGLSSSSLPILSFRSGIRAPPSRASSLPTPSYPLDRTRTVPVSLTASPLTCEPDSVESSSSESKKSGHGRSNSYSPPGSSQFNANRPTTNTKDTAGQRRSFTSFTAVALELDNTQRPESETTSSSNDRTAVPSPAHMEASDSLDQNAPLLPPQQSLAHSVALYALQPARSKNSLGGGSGRPNLRAKAPRATRTRSPSPSPLSRQVELSSDSDGVDSPQEEKKGFKLRPVLSIAPTGPLPLRNRERASPMTPLTPPDTPRNRCVASMYQHKTQSLPLMLPPQHPLDPRDLTGSSQLSLSSLSTLPSSGSLSLPNTPGFPPNSDPTRTFAPGTKVGRFTLVQEQCAKHADVVKQQQEHQSVFPSASRRASMGDLLNGHNWQRSRRISAAPLDWDNSPLQPTPEENVVIFQRKRTRRHLPPTYQKH